MDNDDNDADNDDDCNDDCSDDVNLFVLVLFFSTLVGAVVDS